ncbi:MAG: hypothetical protein ACYS8W_14435 [Planctomycetota bacterium]|jgi:hypothetical protein
MSEPVTRKHGRLFLFLAIGVIVVFVLLICGLFGYRPVKAWYLFSKLESLTDQGGRQYVEMLKKAVASDDAEFNRLRSFFQNNSEEVFLFTVAVLRREGMGKRLPADIIRRFWCIQWGSKAWIKCEGKSGWYITGYMHRLGNGDYEVEIEGGDIGEALLEIGPAAVADFACEYIKNLGSDDDGNFAPLNEYYKLVSQWYQARGDSECVAALREELKRADDDRIKFAIACMLAHMNYFYKDVPLPGEVAPILKKWFRRGNPWEYRWQAACEIQVAGIGKVPASFLIEAIEKGGKYRRAALESFASPYPEVGGLRLSATKFRNALAGRAEYCFFFRNASPPVRLVPILLELWKDDLSGKNKLDGSELDAVKKVLGNVAGYHVFQPGYMEDPDAVGRKLLGKTREEILKNTFIETLELESIPDFGDSAALPILKMSVMSDIIRSLDTELYNMSFYILRRLWAFPCHTLVEDDGEVSKERFEEWFASVEGKTREQILREAIDRDMEIVLNHPYDHHDTAADRKLNLAMNRLFVFCADDYVRTLDNRFRAAGLYVWEEWPRSKKVVDEAKKWWKENRENVKINKVKLFSE